MNSAVVNSITEGRVHLVLEDTAHHLTGQDLLKIAQIAEQAHAAVHISYESWQVLVGVPEGFYELVAEALRTMGFECYILRGEIDELTTFVLNGEATWNHTLKPLARSGSPTPYRPLKRRRLTLLQ